MHKSSVFILYMCWCVCVNSMGWRQVVLGRWKCALVAVKLLREECTELISPAELVAFRQEAQMLQDMHHPYILNHFGACFDCKPVRALPQPTSPVSFSCHRFCWLDVSKGLQGRGSGLNPKPLGLCAQMMPVSEVRCYLAPHPPTPLSCCIRSA